MYCIHKSEHPVALQLVTDTGQVLYVHVKNDWKHMIKYTDPL